MQDGPRAVEKLEAAGGTAYLKDLKKADKTDNAEKNLQSVHYRAASQGTAVSVRTLEQLEPHYAGSNNRSGSGS